VDDRDEVRAWLRAHLRHHAAALRQQLGAHALGIGSADDGGPTLRAYIEPRAGDVAPASPGSTVVPATFSFSVPGQADPTTVPVEIVETPPAELE